MTRTAVILARGLGTRMRRSDDSQSDDPAATLGIKALVNVGRPFIDYLLASLVDAGIARSVLVIGPEHDALKRHCQSLKDNSIAIEFAIQNEPLGTADALKAAGERVGDEPFLLVNSDNYYPVEALKALAALNESGLIGFTPAGLLRGNIDMERLRGFAYLHVENSYLTRVIEKPTETEWDALPVPRLLSMNCWRFDQRIFAACDAIAPSPRGEYELTSAVQYGLDNRSLTWRVIPHDGPVWDLTARQDIARVTAALANVPVPR